MLGLGCCYLKPMVGSGDTQAPSSISEDYIDPFSNALPTAGLVAGGLAGYHLAGSGSTTKKALFAAGSAFVGRLMPLPAIAIVAYMAYKGKKIIPGM